MRCCLVVAALSLALFGGCGGDDEPKKEKVEPKPLTELLPQQPQLFGPHEKLKFGMTIPEAVKVYPKWFKKGKPWKLKEFPGVMFLKPGPNRFTKTILKYSVVLPKEAYAELKKLWGDPRVGDVGGQKLAIWLNEKARIRGVIPAGEPKEEFVLELYKYTTFADILGKSKPPPMPKPIEDEAKAPPKDQAKKGGDAKGDAKDAKGEGGDKKEEAAKPAAGEAPRLFADIDQSKPLFAFDVKQPLIGATYEQLKRGYGAMLDKLYERNLTTYLYLLPSMYDDLATTVQIELNPETKKVENFELSIPYEFDGKEKARLKKLIEEKFGSPLERVDIEGIEEAYRLHLVPSVFLFAERNKWTLRLEMLAIDRETELAEREAARKAGEEARRLAKAGKKRRRRRYRAKRSVVPRRAEPGESRRARVSLKRRGRDTDIEDARRGRLEGIERAD